MTNQQGHDQWSLADWHGKMLLDRNGAKIGKLQMGVASPLLRAVGRNCPT